MSQPSTRVEVSLSALRHNIRQFRKIVSEKTAIMVVIKSNAYGHGIEVAKAVENDVNAFGVVNVQEGVSLRKLGIKKRIVVLGSTVEVAEIQDAKKEGLEIAIFNTDHLDQLSPEFPPLKVHIKINSGLNRLGIAPEHVGELLEKLQKMSCIHMQGLFSHLADAENPASLQTIDQLHVFQTVLEKFPDLTAPLEKHIGATAATLLFPHSHYQLVRLGIGFYGIWPSKETEESWQALYPNQQLTLQPALSFKSAIVCIQDVPAGSLIGYGGTYRTRKPSRIATIPVGYYEGLPRTLNNKGMVIINDHRAPIVGNICMNMTMVNITEIPSAKLGSTVTIIGQENNNQITIDEQATLANTIPYELLTNIPAHIPRLYIE